FLDLRINQEIQTIGTQKIEFTLSLFNVLNFLNKDWGIRKGVGFNNYRAVAIQGYVDQAFINANPQYNLGADDLNKPIISFDPANVTNDEIYEISTLSSRWQLQLGVRYSF